MRATVGVLLLLKGSLAMELLDSHTALEPFSCHKHGFNYTLRYPRYDERFRHAHSMNRCGYNFYPEARRVPLPAVMIDVGANVGQSLLGYASLGWQILAFEPMPLNAVMVRVNVEENGFGANVHLFEGAASNRTGQATIYAPGHGRLDNAALTTNAATIAVKGAPSATQVRLITLSEALQAAEASQGVRPEDVRFIKVDTQASASPRNLPTPQLATPRLQPMCSCTPRQGHEVEVLQGLEAALPRLRHPDLKIMLEYDPRLQNAQGHSPLELGLLARKMGFSVYCRERCVALREQPEGCSDLWLRRGGCDAG